MKTKQHKKKHHVFNKPKHKSTATPLDEFEMLCIPCASRQTTCESEISVQLPPAYFRSSAADRRKARRLRDRRRQRSPGSPELPTDGICVSNYRSGCVEVDCPRSHEFRNPRKLKVCRFYIMDICTKGSRCAFMHEQFPCLHFYLGIPNHDINRCRFMHGGPLDEDLQAALLDHILCTAPKHSHLTETTAMQKLRARNAELMVMQQGNQVVPSSTA